MPPTDFKVWIGWCVMMPQIFPAWPLSRNYFWSKKLFAHLFSPLKKLMLCSLISGEQVLTPSLSKQPPIPTKFPSFLTRYDTHKVYTETLSFSHLWGHLCPFNHLYGNVNIFWVYHFYFKLWFKLYKIKMHSKYLLCVFLYLS